MCLFAMLATAAWLRPASAGLGTHHQLGLPPCSFRVLLGMRCPACGMTTSWSHYVRGQWVSSLHANPGGFMLAVLATVVGVGAVRVGYTGRPADPQQTWLIAIGLIGAMSVALVDWIVRLV
ncbi:hypothetical protein CA51_18560 [Rosistilla oblonga]|uniref:DUF2752 domain-containing protein n=1 Tax=Rosistilla oblonga TaxID=2527990 RepID=A0A518IS55_9BACT|nr:DUF2752 domain-containing protein [Rosistilla oblonga]QDV11980.1 hypothetical protein CA51_18560 [Rosistilla oblonga]QDV55929.1 hypothetical protein Mal33_19080 [Rosistilla oblonga]